MSLACVVLAAGQGTRMKSDRPKVLHPLAGKPMIYYPLQAVAPLRPEPVVVVVGHGGEQVRRALADSDGYLYVEQREQKGTGHAVLQARPLLKDKAQTVLVLYGADPLFSAETLRRLVETHRREGAAMTLTTALFPEAPPYGRVLRDEGGRIVGLVEDPDATPDQRMTPEMVCGALCFDGTWLWRALARVEPSPVKGEIYLTALVNVAAAEGARVASMALEDWREGLGINDRLELAEAQQVVWQRIRERHLLGGVTLLDPASVYIDQGVTIGPDTTLHPNTYLEGDSHIGPGCRLGPGTRMRDSRVGRECEIEGSWLEEAVVGDHVHIGPFTHVRPGSRIGNHCHLGNSAEVKNSTLGEHVHVHHFSYLGDATVGSHVNIGAGTITANYDGVHKLPTIIEEGAFIGVDTMLVAPVRVGRNAKTGAGAVVTKDVPDGCLAVGAPARVIRGPDGQRLERGRRKPVAEEQA